MNHMKYIYILKDYKNLLKMTMFNQIKYNIMLIWRKIYIIQYIDIDNKQTQDVPLTPCFSCERLCFLNFYFFSNQLLR